MENVEDKLVKKVFKQVMYDYCDAAWLSVSSKSLELFDEDGKSKIYLSFDTEEETLFMANLLFNYGISIRLDDVNKFKIVEDKQVIPLCKED